MSSSNSNSLQSFALVVSAVQDVVVSLTKLRRKVALAESAVGSDVLREYHSLIMPVAQLIRSGSTSPPNDPLDFDIHVRSVVEQLQEWMKGAPETTVSEIVTLLNQADLAALPNVRLITNGLVSGSAPISAAASNLRADLASYEASYPYVSFRSQFAADEAAKIGLIGKIREEIASTIREGINVDTPEFPVDEMDILPGGTIFGQNKLSMFANIWDAQLVVSDPGNAVAPITAWLAPHNVAGNYYSRWSGTNTFGVISMWRSTGAAVVLPANTAIMTLTNRRSLPLILKYKLRLSAGVRDIGPGVPVTTNAANAAFGAGVTYEWYGATSGTTPVAVPATTNAVDNYSFGTLKFAPNETLYLRSPTGYANASTAFGCKFEVVGGFLDAKPLFGTSTDFAEACNTPMTAEDRGRYCNVLRWDHSTEQIMRKLKLFCDYMQRAGVAGHMAEGIFPSTSTAAIDNRVSDGNGGYITLMHNDDIFDPCFWVTLKGTYPSMGSVSLLVRRFLSRMQIVSQVMASHQGFLESLHH
jgi:hypothetical protein